MLTRQSILIALLAAAGLALGCTPPPDRPPPDTAILAPPPQEEAVVESEETTEMEGAVQHGATSAPSPFSLPADLPEGVVGDEIRNGWRIFDSTPQTLSAAAEQRGEFYDGNALSCRNCHLDHGTRSSAIPLVNFTEEKRYSPREGLVITGAQRLNACLQRSLNASPLPDDSSELSALSAYLKWIAQQPRASESDRASIREFPDRRADFVTGEIVFYSHCAFCHGDDPAMDAPPLWGPQSYGAGSDMNRLLIATAFVKANMPPEGSVISMEEAYDVAAFVNSLERPYRKGLERDYPALSKKPVDSPYPPYPDSFTQEEHQFGPFRPILERHELLRQADRWVYWVEHGTRAGSHSLSTVSETE